MNVWNGKSASFFKKLSNIVILNMMFLILSIPIFTSISSIYALVKIQKDSYTDDVIRTFFRLFYINFKTHILINVSWVITGVTLTLDFIYFFNIEAAYSTVLICLAAFMLFLYLVTSVFLIPVMVEFELKGFRIIKEAFSIAFYALPTSISVLLLVFASITVVFYFPITILFVGSFTVMVNYNFCHRIFEKLKTKTINHQDNSY